MLNISDKQKEEIGKICETFGVTLLLLFGSQVSGKTHDESDIDLAFATKRKLSFKEHAKLNSEFQSILGKNRIDTVDLLTAGPLLKKLIFDEHNSLYIADKELYYSMANYAMKSYIETKPLREYTRQFLHKKYVHDR